MANKLQLHIQKIAQFNKDRITWLRLSGFVIITIILIIVDQFLIQENKFHWILVSIGLVLSAAWWYWTMKIVRELLDNKLREMDILSSIVLDIQEIKNDIKKIDQKP